jgi:putative radical SAM enzyme (TIGR03279 family)
MEIIKPENKSARVISVPPWSLAYELGIQIGDEIIEINDNKLRDLLDLNFYFDGCEELSLLIRRGEEEILFELEKDFDDELGVEFETPLFNGIRECANDCPFCFVKQQPFEETRKTLHIKDDDFRLSYLHGSYITLTNLSSADRRRIETLRPGPLYISVHASEPEIRNKMLGRKKSIPIIEELKWLDSLDIPCHTQIVLCPGINDGVHLEQTLNDLYKLKNKPVKSVAIVPVGLTKYHQGQLRRFNLDELLQTINQVESWEKQNPKRKSFVFLSDEFYLMSHNPVPPKEFYGDYPQLEDGVGITRLFLNELEDELKNTFINLKNPKKISWLNASLAKALLDKIAKKISQNIQGLSLEVISIDSNFWGTTNVTGLITGRDILEGLANYSRDDLGEALIIPKIMLKQDTKQTYVFLDDLSLADLEKKLNIPCIPAWGAKELISTLIS